jgi:hypothetical protein
MDNKINIDGFQIVDVGMENNTNIEDTFEYWYGTDNVDEYTELWLQGRENIIRKDMNKNERYI